ncbi:MAG: pyrroline-5-carboxylate reductase [Candidatus Omnitrophica bacterium]|nr:pyrroline-5-carboxylate reductase [Candidatus Omnitrophota bacterium]
MSQVTVHKLKIGIIGCGNMGTALVENLAKTVGPGRIIVFDRETAKQESLIKGFKVGGAASAFELIEKSDIVIIAVKPQDIDNILDLLKGCRDKLVVSIAAGKTLEYLASKIGAEVPIVRAMPNLNALVQASTTGSSINLSVLPLQKKAVEEIFDSIGTVVPIDENLMNAFTAICGSGPAFVAYVMTDLTTEQIRDVFVQEALAFGFQRSAAETMAQKTIEGTLKILKLNFDRDVFIKKVCSKGGTTEAGIKVLEQKGKTAEALSLAVRAAARRAEELSKN